MPDISRLHLDRAELAYLASCSTAATGFRHADEALNLAAAFQLAGNRHVVATLWPRDDAVAVAAADTFYAQLPPTATTDTAARALHDVTRVLRARHPDESHLWASFVHNGP